MRLPVWVLSRLLVAADISYAYAAWSVAECPGHWRRDSSVDRGGPGELPWIAGKMLAEDAIFIDFIADLEAADGTILPGARP